METIEEKAWELYPDVPFKEDVESEDTFRKNEIRILERAAFMRGYDEAMRCIELKKEKPECALNKIEKIIMVHGKFRYQKWISNLYSSR